MPEKLFGGERMPVYLKELVKLVKTLNYEQKAADRLDATSLVDKLLGKFEDKNEKSPGTKLLRELRESGYGKY